MAKSKKTVVVEKKLEIQQPKVEEAKVAELTLLNVSEMTIKEIMLQKNLSYEGAISFLKANQNK